MPGAYESNAGLPWIELIEGVGGEFDHTGGTAVRKFRVYRDVALDCAYLWAGRHNIFPALECKRWAYEVAPASKSNTYGPGPDELIVTAYYAPIMDDAEGPVWSIEASVDVLDVGKGRTWSDGTTAIDQSVNVKLPKSKISAEHTGYGTIPLNTIYAALGKINASEWRGQPAGRALFVSASSRSTWDLANFTWKYRITYEFLINPDRSHNEVWRKDTGVWDTTTPVLYESADFSLLGV